MELRKRTVAILIFEGVELLDFAGPFEVFSAVRKPPDRTESLMEIFAVAESMSPITCRNGLVVQPAYALDDCPPADILVIPGGQGTRTAVHRQPLIDWIAAHLKGRICIDLDIDRQDVTRFGTPEEIDALIRDAVVKLGSREGGLMMIYGLYPGVPLENIKALMDALERYAGHYA